MRQRIAALVAALVAGGLLTPASAAPPRTYAVVGLLDSGINPYHVAFRDTSPRAYKHPSTYLPGFPKSAKALRLTFRKGDDLAESIDRDCDRVWLDVVPGELYWVPGTRIVGAISFMAAGADACASPPIVSGGGHGTMTASRAAGNGYGACPTCLIVMAQGIGSTYSTDAVKWLGDNASWIDVESHSWGPILPTWTGVDTGSTSSNGKLVRTVEAGARKHLSFWASGNGAAFRFGAVGHPTQLAPHFTPSVLIVGGVDSGRVITWPGFTAHLVSDSCDSWAAHHDKNTSAEDVGGGTSGATPYAAGQAARLALEARALVGDRRTGVRGGNVAVGKPGRVRTGPLADGKLTMAEWRDVLLKTATERPKAHHADGPPCGVTAAPYGPAVVEWSSVPAEYPEYVQIGYGATDPPAFSAAVSVLRGRKPLPTRPDTDAFFVRDRALREAIYTVASNG